MKDLQIYSMKTPNEDYIGYTRISFGESMKIIVHCISICLTTFAHHFYLIELIEKW